MPQACTPRARPASSNEPYGNYSQTGMSRIKIIILTAIISLGVLAVILALSSARHSAANQNRLADITQIHEALKFFYDQNGYYPYGRRRCGGAGEEAGTCAS